MLNRMEKVDRVAVLRDSGNPLSAFILGCKDRYFLTGTGDEVVQRIYAAITNEYQEDNVFLKKILDISGTKHLQTDIHLSIPTTKINPGGYYSKIKMGKDDFGPISPAVSILTSILTDGDIFIDKKFLNSKKTIRKKLDCIDSLKFYQYPISSNYDKIPEKETSDRSFNVNLQRMGTGLVLDPHSGRPKAMMHIILFNDTESQKEYAVSLPNNKPFDFLETEYHTRAIETDNELIRHITNMGLDVERLRKEAKTAQKNRPLDDMSLLQKILKENDLNINEIIIDLEKMEGALPTVYIPKNSTVKLNSEEGEIEIPGSVYYSMNSLYNANKIQLRLLNESTKPQTNSTANPDMYA